MPAPRPAVPVVAVDARQPAPDIIRRATDLLAAGELVVLPTETVYGLCADVLQVPAAGERLYEAKGRPADKPVAFLISSAAQVRAAGARLPPVAARLAERFWPGPLTLVLETEQGTTLGFRMPDHAVPLAVLRRLGRPLAATSANRSGEPDPRTAADAARAVGSSAALVLDAGPAAGTPSTVVRLTGEVWSVLRPGAVSETDLRAALA